MSMLDGVTVLDLASVDAGIAAGIALAVVERDLVDFAGVAPIMLLGPGMSEPITVDGLGHWPRQLDLDRYLEIYHGDMPVGISRSVTRSSGLSAVTCALACFIQETAPRVLHASVRHY